ncbi:MAG: bifunctional oligoribonuclease/PAP phosphatase NrnA [Candidatus Zixiibacteriota bacterium]
MRKIFKDIETLIKDAQSILISAHIDPDGDSLGTQLALRRYLIGLDKKVRIINQGPIPGKYKFLPDIEEVKSINGYDSDEKFDLAVILECRDVERTGEVKNLLNGSTKIINIDHHPDNTGYGNVACLDDKASAVAEILTEYFLEIKHDMDADAATQLYTAILTDTGRFRFNSTSRRTMEIAGRLIELGADPRHISDSVYYSLDESTMRLIGKVFSRMEFYDSGRICLIAIDNEMIRTTDFNSADTEGMAEYTLFGKRVQAGGLLREMRPGHTKVSLRSRVQFNVGALAHRYGGGGHKNASGFHIDLPLDAALEQVLNDLKEVVNDAV